MVITTDELSLIMERLILYLKEQDIDHLQLAVDYYWNIPEDQIYNPYETPHEFTLGQLSDNWNELVKIVEDKKEPIAYSFIWLSTILRAIGEKLMD